MGTIAAKESKWLTLAATCLGVLVLNIDLFIVNIALPDISSNFHVAYGSVSWIVSIYALMIGVFPGGLGRIGDLWGQKKLYLAGFILFTLASLACGMANGITLLIVFRALQGIGAAALIPGTMSLLVSAFPKEQRGLAIGINSGIGGLGLVAGPVLGGILVHGSSWNLIFFVNVPIGIVAIVLTALFVKEAQDKEARPKVDWAGLVLLSAGVSAILYAFTRAESRSFDRLSVLSIAAGLIVLLLFIWFERKVKQPLIDLSLFKNAFFALPLISMFLFSAALFGSQPLFSLFFQNFWGFSPLQGGLAFVPATLLIAICAPFAGIISARSGKKLPWVVMAGVVLVALSFLYLTMLGTASHYEGGVLPSMLIRGIGIPVLMSSSSLMIMNAIPEGKAGLASGLLNMSRNVGTALGIALLGKFYALDVGKSATRLLGQAAAGMREEVKARAIQFTVTDKEGLQLLSSQMIVHGFHSLVVICTLCLVPAFLVILFVARGTSLTKRKAAGLEKSK